jgi:hypothetical protein
MTTNDQEPTLSTIFWLLMVMAVTVGSILGAVYTSAGR